MKNYKNSNFVVLYSKTLTVEELEYFHKFANHIIIHIIRIIKYLQN